MATRCRALRCSRSPPVPACPRRHRLHTEGSAADYRLRIFTPKRELPFAGHPTMGSASAVLRRGLQARAAGRLVQQQDLTDCTTKANKQPHRYPNPKLPPGTERKTQVATFVEECMTAKGYQSQMVRTW